jgi:hypothetical protein
LVGGERKRGAEDGHKHGFSKNLPDRRQAAGNPGLGWIVFHKYLAISVDESAPVAQSLFLPYARTLAQAGWHFERRTVFTPISRHGNTGEKIPKNDNYKYK